MSVVADNPSPEPKQKFPFAQVALTSVVMTGVTLILSKIFEIGWDRVAGRRQIANVQEPIALPAPTPPPPQVVIVPQSSFMGSGVHPMLTESEPRRPRAERTDRTERPMNDAAAPMWFANFEKAYRSDANNMRKRISKIEESIDEEDEDEDDEDEEDDED